MTVVDLSIEPATDADLSALVALLVVLFTQEAEFAPDAPTQARGLRLILENADVGQVLVARHAGQAVGMVSVLFTVSTALGGRVGLLEDLVVRPAYRGRGVGRRLVQAAVDAASRAGCLRLTLLTPTPPTPPRSASTPATASRPPRWSRSGRRSPPASPPPRLSRAPSIMPEPPR